MNKLVLIATAKQWWASPLKGYQIYLYGLNTDHQAMITAFTICIWTDKPEQTVKNRIKRHILRRLIRVYTVGHSSIGVYTVCHSSSIILDTTVLIDCVGV